MTTLQTQIILIILNPWANFNVIHLPDKLVFEDDSIHIHIHIHIYISTCIYTCMYIYIHTYMCIYIYMHIYIIYNMYTYERSLQWNCDVVARTRLIIIDSWCLIIIQLHPHDIPMYLWFIARSNKIIGLFVMADRLILHIDIYIYISPMISHR